ncbi:MAG: penicillin-binding protein 2 [Coriobacteriales bacterium]|jgi:penicillin-binding protein 2|nr:penicillin-binding protein 2 [Coriobacteriales bacterium]
MTAVQTAICIGVAIFILVVLASIVILRLRSTHSKTVVVKRSFGRHSAPRGVGIDDVRKPDPHEEPGKNNQRSRLFLFGAFIAAVFGSILVKLWSLQLLSGDTYTKLAEDNMTSEVSVPATRGRLLDRIGRELVGNRVSMMVTGPKRVASDRNIVHRLSLVLGMPVGQIRKALLDDNAGSQADRVIARDVTMRIVSYIKEHPHLFGDVQVEERTVRNYPYGSLAAHILGYIGPVTEADLLIPNQSIDYQSGDYIGKGGAEQQFEGVLQGIRGVRTYKVDVDGNPSGLLSEQPAQNGSDVCLTLDLDIQKACDRILGFIVPKAVDLGYFYANAAALVVIDVKDGGILGASSYPTYNPDDFTDGISTDLWEELNAKESAYPLTNRVISGLYPAASTFKAFTGMAGQMYGIIEEDTEFECEGWWEEYGEQWGQRCWVYPDGHGIMDLENAVNVSCDIFFYNVASRFYERWEESGNDQHVNLLQDYLKTWGFGSVTGIDLPGEAYGRVPDPAWKLEAFADTPEDAQWQPGDMTNMIIGQGDILITPLQLAHAYAGVASGKLLVPHVFSKILDSQGNIVVGYEPKESQIQPLIEKKYMDRIHAGLAMIGDRETTIFGQFPCKVSGKSGTAEVASAPDDFGWFVAFAPREDPQYCVACVVENGGEGSGVPIAGVQHALAACLGVDLGDIEIRSSRTGER